MRTFIIVACVSSGGFAFLGPLSAEAFPTTADEIEARFEGHAQFDDLDLDEGVAIIEVPADTAFVVPTSDSGDEVALVELRANSKATHLDVAGVERTAAGRPVDAQPGSMDAALTGMQHDIGAGTVRNTVSPDPTPSRVVQEALAEDPELAEQPAPTEDVAKEESDKS